MPFYNTYDVSRICANSHRDSCSIEVAITLRDHPGLWDLDTTNVHNGRRTYAGREVWHGVGRV